MNKLDELQKKKEEIEAEIQKVIQAERDEVLAQVRKLIKQYGITRTELSGAFPAVKRGRKKGSRNK